MSIPYCVYILQCKNGKFYVGYTTCMEKRLKAHKKGEVKFTKNKLPVKLIHLSKFSDKTKAYNFERYLKSGSGKAFMKRHLT